ncbi:MAG: YajQ family cyclic di-GMP-binding protein [Pseudomonadales bacterium]|nr:YajQ family cyclic di-GMP-binding protein [Pseudomonadales bacterium]
MPSFDAVSEIDLQVVRNSVDQANRELETRFDFRGVDCGFELKDQKIQIHADEDFQLKQLEEMLRTKLAKNKIDANCLTPGEIEASGKSKRISFGLIEGIEKDVARNIVKLIKSSKLKVQSAIQGEQVRITGKKRDDLQAVMSMLKEADIEIPIQFTNFRD